MPIIQIMASNRRTVQFFYFLSIVFCVIWACPDDELYVIRTGGPGLVLDGSDPSGHIQVQHFNGFSTQLWRFQTGVEAGVFYIVNNHTGNVLDFTRIGLLTLVMKEKRNIKRQQWNLTPKGRIANAENEFNIDVDMARFVPGNRVILWEENGKIAQEFSLEKKV